MSQGDPPRVAITPLGRVRAATLVFRASGHLRAAAIVKATFSMVQDRPMTLADPDPIYPVDQHRDGDPMRSLSAASDLVPYRPRVDVVLQGHARAPLGHPTARLALRMMVARGQQVLLDKRLAAQGARDASGQVEGPMPFEALPLLYELSASGTENPVGIPERGRNWPSVVDPWYRALPVGFGPIGDRWPARRGLLAALGGGGAILEALVPDFPADFPWGFFNASPEDQRMAHLAGDEWLGFEGMHAELPRVQSCLPGVRAAARVYGPRAETAQGQPISMVADTVVIDADRLSVSVVWRGTFPVASREELAVLHVFAGVETAAEPLAFPPSYAPAHRAQPQHAQTHHPQPPQPTPFQATSPGAPPRPGQTSSRLLSLEEATAMAMRAAGQGKARAAAKDAPKMEAPRAPAGPVDLSATLAIDDEALHAVAATPFEGRTPAPPRPAPGTQVVSLQEATALAMKAATPFNKGSQVIPAVPAAPSALQGRVDLSATLAVDDSAPRSALPSTPFEKPQTLPPSSVRAAAQPAAARSPKQATQALSLDAMIEMAAKGKGAAMPFAPVASEAPREAPARPLPVATPFDRPDAASLLRAPVPPAEGAETVDIDPVLVYGPSLASPPESARRPSIGESMAQQGLAPITAAPLAPAPLDLPPILDVPEGEPKTLGGHFLAAMARAHRGGPSPRAPR